MIIQGTTAEFATMETLEDALHYARAKGIDTIAYVTVNGVFLRSAKEGF